MKKSAFALFFLIGIGTFCVYGQTKNEDILKLLRISGTDKMADQMMNAMIPQLKQLVPGIPDAFWVKFREKLNVDDLLYACIPVYNKYYTHNEISQLIAFYESPIGKKVVETAPILTQETMAIGQKWGERLGQDIVNELINEGYVKN
jgi:hypothetical protein